MNVRGMSFCATAFAILLGFLVVGPLRVVVGVRCAVDRARGGAERRLGDLVVRLPPSWCEQHRDASDPSKLDLMRVPRTRSSRHTMAHLRRFDFTFSGNQAQLAGSILSFVTPYDGRWRATRVLAVDLGGEPGYEITFERVSPRPGEAEEVSSDFVSPQKRLWVSCPPMGRDDLAECREIASTSSVP